MSQKLYRVTHNVGNARHVVSYHDGVETHQDGSPFFGIRILSTVRDRDRFVKELKQDGYVEQGALRRSE